MMTCRTAVAPRADKAINPQPLPFLLSGKPPQASTDHTATYNRHWTASPSARQDTSGWIRLGLSAAWSAAMYSLAVSDHVMIAHSFVGEIFGPAQQLHGATYAVEAEFRRASLDASRLVCD